LGVGITYMGTKRELASSVLSAVRTAKDGVFLDAFSGMCAIGEEIGTERQVWSNDAQYFASEVANALFVSCEAPLSTLSAAELLYPEFSKHESRLSQAFERSLELENECKDSREFDLFAHVYQKLGATLATERQNLDRMQYVLFSRLYPNTYIGTAQAIEIDAIIRSINKASRRSLISNDQRRWLLIALGRSILKCSSTTGHFAQFLQPKVGSYRRFIEQRKKRIWEEWLKSIDLLSPVGTAPWRFKNRVFNEDSLMLVKRLKKKRIRPRVVYADPPYTDDQYSRFYHLLETLLKYDYPHVSGKGRYRGNRFHTPFSLRSKVKVAFQEFVGGVAAMGSDLVLSYPSNGLLVEVGEDPLVILREHFPKANCYHAISHKHSTMGASKGSVVGSVTEFIYLATQ